MYIPTPIWSFSLGQTSYSLEPTAIQLISWLSQLLQVFSTSSTIAQLLAYRLFFFFIQQKKHFSGLSLENTLPVRSLTNSTEYCSWFSPYMRILPALKFSRQNLRSVFFSIMTGIPGTVLPPPPVSQNIGVTQWHGFSGYPVFPLFFSGGEARLFFIPPPELFTYIPTLFFSFQLRLVTDTFETTVLQTVLALSTTFYYFYSHLYQEHYRSAAGSRYNA